ncbi:hypothetical protein Tco_0998105 [Tanacetum coccineum]
MDVHVHHKVTSNQTSPLLIVSVSIIIESSPIYTTVIPKSLPSFAPSPPQSTPTPTTKATNPLSALPNFASVFQFNNRVTALEKEVVELKKDDPLNTQVTALVDEHLDSRLGATKYEFMNYLFASITARITKQVKIQLPQILPKEVSNFTPSEIKCMVAESLEHAVLAKESSQPKSRKDKDKDEDPSAGSDRGLKKRKTRKDAEPTTGLKTKESKSGSSKGTKSQSKSSRKSFHAKEPEFEVTDSDMP